MESYNDRSLPDEVENIFAPDLVVVNESAGLEAVGIETYLEHAYHGWLRAVPDAHVELVDYEVGDETVDSTLRSDGTFEGTMKTADGSIPGTGRAFEIELHMETDIDEGRISRWVSTFDVESWQGQVGMAEAA